MVVYPSTSTATFSCPVKLYMVIFPFVGSETSTRLATVVSVFALRLDAVGLVVSLEG